MKDDNTQTLRFMPHWTEILKIRRFLPAAAGLLSCAGSLLRGRFGAAAFCIPAAGFAVTLLMLLDAERKRRKTFFEIRGGVLLYLSPSREKRLGRERTERVQTGGGFFTGLLGGTRLRIDSDASRAAWLSVRVSRKNADAIAGRILHPGEETGRIVPGRYSAAVFAFTSQRSTLLLIASAFFTLFAGDGLLFLFPGACLTAAALTDMLLCAVRFRRLSLSRCRSGWMVTGGRMGRRKTFLPDRAVAGAVIHRSPVAVLCGFGSIGLLTRAGRYVPCACRVSRDELRNSAMKLVGVQDDFCARLSETDAVRRTYASGMLPALFAVLLSGYFALCAESVPSRFFACCAGCLMTAAAVRCLAGLACAADFGLYVSPSAFFAGGMKGVCAECCILRRGTVAGLRVSSGLFRRMNGLCSAVPFPSGRRSGVKCRCVSFGALNGFAARFSG